MEAPCRKRLLLIVKVIPEVLGCGQTRDDWRDGFLPEACDQAKEPNHHNRYHQLEEIAPQQNLTTQLSLFCSCTA